MLWCICCSLRLDSIPRHRWIPKRRSWQQILGPEDPGVHVLFEAKDFHLFVGHPKKHHRKKTSTWKLYQHRPQIAKTIFCVRSSPSTPTIAHYNGTLHWHPAMAPRPLPQSWPSPSSRHSTLQWHPAMAPSNSTTSTPPKLVVTLPPTIAHYYGTLRLHPARHHVHCTLHWHPGATSNLPKWLVALPPYWK